MHPADSATTFQAAVASAGKTLEELNAAEALSQMVDFYRNVRADNCILDEEGDTLLYSWGMIDQAQDPCFQLELTRHFIEPGDEDEDGMSQLSLTLDYAPTTVLKALKPGTNPCGTPGELADFEKAVHASQVYRLLSPLQPQKRTLSWFQI